MYQEHYQTTELEDLESNMYKKIVIFTPSLINEQRISSYFDIYLKKKPMHSSFHIFGRYRDIVIDDREPKEKHREIFFHELRHILKHAGIQSLMPTAFRELQERDAQHFMSEVLVGAIFKHFELSQLLFEIDNSEIKLATIVYLMHSVLGMVTLFSTGYAVFLSLRINLMKKQALLLILLAGFIILEYLLP